MYVWTCLSEAKALEQTLFIKTKLVNKQNLLNLFLKRHDFQGISDKTRTENFYMTIVWCCNTFHKLWMEFQDFVVTDQP